MVLALVSFGIGHQWSKLRQNSSPDSEGVATANYTEDTRKHKSNAAPLDEVTEVREATDLETAEPTAPRQVETLSRAAAEPAEPVTRSEPTPLTRQLVKNLTQMDLSQGPLTTEQAAQWKEGLQQLIEQGGPALAAIQEFLEVNRDWEFGAANPLGFPSLRTAFLDALDQIGGPEAQGLLLRTLQTTAVPAEVARVARSLQRLAPGQFLEEIRTAVRETLAQAATGQLPGWDVGPLFQVLQNYGDASTAADLEKNASRWNYYSALTLANLPSGAGIPALVKLAQESSGTGSRSAALEALAQVAVQFPAAGEALVELARSGQLSEKNWLAAASALEGTRYSIRENGMDRPPIAAGFGLKSYYLARGDQRFYSTPALGGMSIEQIQQRIAIIDQLLAVNPSAASAEALQNARASLLTKSQQASAN